MPKTQTDRDRPLTRKGVRRGRSDARAGGFAASPKASQARLAGILDIADDAIISVDSQQHITLFNQGAERIFGYVAKEVLGRPLDLLLPARFEHIHRRHLAEFATSDETVRRMGERSDIYGRRKDGTEFPAEASISKLEIEGEQVFTVILRDISARKLVEQTLRAQNIELERASQAKDRFLASMSHELRTPLNAIIGFIGTLLMRLPGPLNADQEKQLRTVQSSAKHLLSLINDLLDLAKIESGKVEFNLEPVVCQDVIAEVVAGLRPLAEQKGVVLAVAEHDEPIILQSDRRVLAQIVLNLANNAIKFTERGEVRVALAQEHGADQVRTTISVADTGIGIQAEDQARLFQAFEQADSAAARRREGTGLGLHLSQKLAQLLGGWVEFESEYGSGSTFMLVIVTSK
jgi:protein-histidine pros-kinase